MRRLLLAAALAAAALSAPAYADPCGSETEPDCHPYDCLAWEPVNAAPQAVDELLAGDPVYAVSLLLPPPCPPSR